MCVVCSKKVLGKEVRGGGGGGGGISLHYSQLSSFSKVKPHRGSVVGNGRGELAVSLISSGIP